MANDRPEMDKRPQAGSRPKADKKPKADARPDAGPEQDVRPAADTAPKTGSEKRLNGFSMRQILTGLGAFIGALVMVMIHSNDLWQIITQRAQLPSLRHPSVDAGHPLDKKTCCTLKIRHPKTIPLLLFPRLPHRDYFPYWFKVEAENSCNEELTIDIEFKRYRGPFAIDKDSKTFSDTLPIGSYAQRIDPTITITDYDAEEPMVIKWTIRDDRGTRLDQGVTEIELLPRNTIAWDLTEADGKPVSREYLFASLAAWTATGFPGLEEMAASCGQVRETTTDREAADRLRDCHHRLFVEENPVFLSENPLRFPVAGRQIVRPPFKVLEKKHANQIEAALLFAAVGRRLGPRFRLIGRPAPEGGVELKSFLLAWQSTPAAQWLAVDLGRPPGTAFEDNLSAGTAELKQLQWNRPEIFLALDATGIYLDDDHSAIDFRQADQHFDIGPFPS